MHLRRCCASSRGTSGRVKLLTGADGKSNTAMAKDHSNSRRAKAIPAELVNIEPEETVVRLEANAAKWELEARARGKTPRARALAARRAARCRKLAQKIRTEAATSSQPAADGS